MGSVSLTVEFNVIIILSIFVDKVPAVKTLLALTAASTFVSSFISFQNSYPVCLSRFNLLLLVTLK